MSKETSNNNTKNPLNISENIFSCLRKLTNENENRIIGSVNLVRQLFNGKTTKHEYMYSLKRLIRGVGSSTTESRACFFTSLIGLLDFSLDDEFNCDEILDLTIKELTVGSSNKEDGDAIAGTILVCGALIRSNKFKIISDQDLNRISKMLISASKSKTYNKMLAFKFLVDLLQTVSEKKFKAFVLPIIQEEIGKCGYKYDIFIMYILIEIFKRFPNLEITETNVSLSHSNIINPENFECLSKCLIENSLNIMQPAFDSVCIYLANYCDLKKFWKKLLNMHLNKKNKESNILKIVINILKNSSESSLSFILSEHIVSLISNGLNNIGNNKEKCKPIYDEFFEAVLLYCNKTNTTSKDRLAIIKSLILHPGILTIETYTSKRIIHQIVSKCDEDAIKALYEIYKEILLNKRLKNPNDASDLWSDSERSHAGYMMQNLLNQKTMQTSYKWKSQELNLVMLCGFFYTNINLEIVEKENNAEITEKLAVQMRNIFFCSLQNKLSTLENESKTLFHLVKTFNSVIKRKNFDVHLRFNIKKNVVKIWNEMFTEIQNLQLIGSKSNKKTKNQLDTVFNVLLMHMGLQLFRNPEMAETAITDLEMCIIKSREKLSQNESKISNIEADVEEPEWIEVVVDLFLHLLSQNSNSLRNIVKSVFPHLCEFLTRSSIHQILEMLIMKNGFNPLVDDQEAFNLNDESNISEENGEVEKIPSKNDEDISDTESEVSLSKNDPATKFDESEDSSTEETNDNHSEASENSDSGESDDNSEESEDSNCEENEEDIADKQAEAEKFRNAVSFALNKNDLNDDGDSIDLDDMDEEVGRKLDEALAEVFKMKKRDNSKLNKRSKTYRTESTAVMHFRIRVLDLIDIYIEHNPSLKFVLEIVKSLFNALEHSSDNDLTPLFIKIEKTLNNITIMKKNFNTENLTDKELVQFLAYVLNKKFKSKSNELQNKMRCKCIIFLIHLKSFSINQKNFEKEVINQLQTSIQNFILSKNSIYNIYFFKSLFNICWHGIWNLALNQTDNVLNSSVKSNRRIQILELLEVLYKNNQLIKQNEKLAMKNFKSIEMKLEQYLTYLINSDNISSKELNAFINLICMIASFHKKKQSKFSFDQNSLCENIQMLRSKIKLENLHCYIKFCSIFNLKQVKNNVEDSVKDTLIHNKKRSLSLNDNKTTNKKQKTK